MRLDVMVCVPSARRLPIGRTAKTARWALPRSERGAVIDDAHQVVERAVTIARERMVVAADGTGCRWTSRRFACTATRGAAELASRIRKALIDVGVQVGAPI